MTDEQRWCSACLAADPPRTTPATHDDYERRTINGRRLGWCEAHCNVDEYEGCPLDDDSTSDRRPAALAVIGVGVLPWLLVLLWMVRP